MEPGGATVEWRVLGDVAVSFDGQPVDLGRQHRLVLGRLLQNPGSAVPAESLVSTADHSSTDAAVSAGRMALSRLRGVLRPFGLDGMIVTTAAGYALAIDPDTVDHSAFQRLVVEASSTDDSSEALRILDEALGLWRGAPYGEWGTHLAFQAHTTMLEEAHRSAVDLWGELAARTGPRLHLIARLEAAIADEPLRERRWASLMLAHYRAGNQAAALRAFSRAREQLIDLVGIEPGRELQLLRDAILRRDGALLEGASQPSERDPTGAGHGVPPVLVGRDRELCDLRELVERHRLVVVTGLGGVGKSSLAMEFARRSTRPAIVVELGAAAPGQLAVVVGRALGVSPNYSAAQVTTALIERCRRTGDLLILDNCQDSADAVAALVVEVARGAPDARILATSRVDLPVDGARSLALGPLEAGSAATPGPAALIAADHAGIAPSEIADRWELISEVCERAGGLPLALELLGASVTEGGPVATSWPDAMTDAAHAAIAALPSESLDVVNELVRMPGDVGIPFLAEHLGVHSDHVRRAAGFAARGGIVVRRTDIGGVRIGLLDPTRDVLRNVLPTGQQDERRLAKTLQQVAQRAQPSLLEAVDRSLTIMLDDEHELTLAVLDHVGETERVELACDLAGIWRACDRTMTGSRALERLEPVLQDASPVDQARYWVMRSQISPSLASRVPYVDRLREAMATGERYGRDDLALRAGFEMAIGLGWAGDLAAASRLLDDLEPRLRRTTRYAELQLRMLRAIGTALAGDLAGGIDELIRVAREFETVGHSGDVLSKLFIATTLAHVGGDETRCEAALVEAERTEIDRFCMYAYAGLSFERALLSVRCDDEDAGHHLVEALRLLTQHGEHRTAEACRLHLGRWRLAHDDPRGGADLTTALRGLIDCDPHVAAVAAVLLSQHAGVSGDGTTADDLAALARQLLSGPGAALPLSAEDRAIVDAAPPTDRPPPPRGALNDVLDAAERRISADMS